MADIHNPSTAMATAVVDELARNGVGEVVVCPGSRSTALAIAAVRHPDLRIHVRHDERSAGFLAIGLARGSGRPAVVIMTSGTAVANLAPAVAEADAAGVPLLVVSADRPAELHDVGANQTLRQARVFDGMVRWSVDLPAASGAAGEPALWRSTACRAFAAAIGVGGGHVGQVGSGGGAGPVHCNLAFREPTIPGLDDGRTTAAPYPHATAGRADGGPWTTHVGAPVDVRGIVGDLITMLDGARVLVVSGDTPEPIVGLEDLPWPVVAEPTAGRRLGAGLAHGSLLLADDGFMNAHPPDVVLRLGHPTLSRAALVRLADVPTVQVSASGIVDPSRRATMAITAPVHEVVAGVLTALADRGTGEVAAATDEAPGGGGSAEAHHVGAGGGAASAEAPGPDSEPPGEWLQTWRRASRLAAAVVAEHLDVADPAESAVARVVAAAVGGRALVVASSLPIRDLADYAAPPADDAAPPAADAAPPAGDAALPVDDAAPPAADAAPPTGGRVFANRGLSGIDGFVSTAVGVALACGPTVALAGDLSFLHDHNGLLVEDPSAIDLDLVVVDNDGGGLFHHVPAVQVPEFEQAFATPHGRDLVAIASAAGVEARRVGIADLPAALASPPGGLRVLVVPTDRHLGADTRRAIRHHLAAALGSL